MKNVIALIDDLHHSKPSGQLLEDIVAVLKALGSEIKGDSSPEERVEDLLAKADGRTIQQEAAHIRQLLEDSHAVVMQKDAEIAALKAQLSSKPS